MNLCPNRWFVCVPGTGFEPVRRLPSRGFKIRSNRPASSPESRCVRDFKDLVSGESGPVRLVMGSTRKSCAPFVHFSTRPRSSRSMKDRYGSQYSRAKHNIKVSTTERANSRLHKLERAPFECVSSATTTLTSQIASPQTGDQGADEIVDRPGCISNSRETHPLAKSQKSIAARQHPRCKTWGHVRPVAPNNRSGTVPPIGLIDPEDSLGCIRTCSAYFFDEGIKVDLVDPDVGPYLLHDLGTRVPVVTDHCADLLNE